VGGGGGQRGYNNINETRELEERRSLSGERKNTKEILRREPCGKKCENACK